jgi:hypothetical protein
VTAAPADRPRLIVYDTIREAHPNLAHLEDALANALVGFNRETTLAIIGNVNARLLHDGLSNAALHERLEADLVYPDLRARLAPVRAKREADLSVIFTRRSLLLLAKLALGIKREDDGRDFDQRDIGTCVLIVNELLEPTAPQSDELLMMDMIANWDMFFPLDLPHLVARFRLLFERLLTSTHPLITSVRDRLGLQRLLFDDLTHEEFQGLLVGVYGIISNVVKDWKAPVLTIEPPLPDFVGSEAGVRAFFSRRSQPVDDFRDWRYGSSWTPEQVRDLLHDDFFLHDLTSFRRQPFIDLGGRYLLPDYEMALERVTYGAYWTIFDHLKGNDRLQFSSAWGMAFEEYIIALFLDAYPQSTVLADVFMRNIPFPGGEIDGLLTFADHTIVFEVKSTLLPVATRSSRRFDDFRTWVEERLVGSEQEKGGLRQLADAATALRSGLLGTARSVVYPVLVTEELSFQALGVNRYLGTVFDGLVGEDPRVLPLTVITTDELEKLLPCVADGLFTWRDVLDRRAADRDGWFWVGQAMNNELFAHGASGRVRRNPVLAREYRAFMKRLRAS